ncbi:NAD-dependent epimerase/dehydratase family protein [Salsipaludibacter albus]|uniref:NAD-dependent epimerase/dehydratase family protein n=1 Tax=Salsipaludibacter albus TaxID=2849650 RepID=UPI001EE4B755|nr:NAD(P)-dependent oxidoreductase [Salsipaludibacter albus]MBY5161727.1 NAD(P)-dependent oxidoreductase [Salsipaludibacter albus]
MPRLLVTGAAGFIGRHVVAAATADGWEVVGLDRRRWAAGPAEHAVVADLHDAVTRPLLTEVDAVVHLAGAPGVRDDRPDVARRRWSDNVGATAVVAEGLPRDRPLLVASSSSVYGGAGRVGRHRPCHEDEPLAPRGGYARSKVAVEQVLARTRTGPGPTVVVRPFTVAGEGQRPDMALARWLAAARAGQPIEVFGSLDRRRDVTDVREVAAAMLRLLDGGHHGTFNLGSGTTHSLGDHVDAVAAVVGRRPEVRVVASHRREVATTWADTTRLETAVGGLAATSLVDLVARQATAQPVVEHAGGRPVAAHP